MIKSASYWNILFKAIMRSNEATGIKEEKRFLCGQNQLGLNTSHLTLSAEAQLTRAATALCCCKTELVLSTSPSACRKPDCRCAVIHNYIFPSHCNHFFFV